MKTKIILNSFILLAMLTVTACSSNPENSDSTSSQIDTPEAAELMVYENKKTPAQPQSGGGFDVNPKNTKDCKLNYKYDDLGDIRAYFSPRVPEKGQPNKYEYDHLNNAYGLDYMPSTGNVNLLVIPVKLADYDESKNEEEALEIRAKARQDIYKAYFGSEEDIGGYESVRTFFDKSSFGALQIGGTVTDWYYTDKTTDIGKDGKGGNPMEVSDLVGEAFEWFKKTYHSDGTEFDSDHDGYVDAICLIYNAPAKYNYTPDSQLWAYCYWRTVRQGTAAKPNANAFFWASTSFMSGHNKEIIDTHTYIHELGHVMGLDDYYNYYNQVNGATGGFIMEDMNIGDHDPFSKMALNWITPTVVTGSTTVDLKSFTETGQVLIIKPDTKGFDSPFSEYLALEFYTPTGLNKYDVDHLFAPLYIKGPNAYGVRMWHVDARLLKYDNEGHMEVTERYEKNSKDFDYVVANTNTQNGPYASKNPDFRDYRLLHCIQAGVNDRYWDGKLMSKGDLFVPGNWFNMGSHKNYFANKGKFNDGSSFENLSIDFLSVTKDHATIEVTM